MAGAIGAPTNPPPRSTMFAQHGTIEVHTEGQRQRRQVPILIPLGGGTWRETAGEAGATPAAYTMPSLGTQIALALWPGYPEASDSAVEGVPQEEAHEVRAHTMNMIAEVDHDAMHLHSLLENGLTNISVALGPGDIIIAAVAAGGSIRIRDACEGVEVVLPHHASVAITHPNQAGMHAARHLIDETTQIALESVTGAVWHYQRRRRTVGLNSRTGPPVEEAPTNNGAHPTYCGKDRRKSIFAPGNKR